MTVSALLQGLFAAGSVITGASLLTLAASGHGSLIWGDSDTSSNQRQVREFDQLDAAKACSVEAQDRFDGQLLRYHIDDHSSRYEESRGVYLVVLQGHVGTRRKFDEAMIYCYIRPSTNQVTYFRAYDGQKRSLQSGLGFGSLKDIFSW